MHVRSRLDYRAAMTLLAAGMSDREVSARTGVPVSTVGRWRRGQSRIHRRLDDLERGWSPPDRDAYSYLLGLYLGDGHLVTPTTNAAALVLSLDRQYPGIERGAIDALRQVFPDATPTRSVRRSMEVALVRLSHPALPIAFPQHGPGKKHTRAIELAPWQARLTEAHPKALLRGLIHSDGCRTVNRFSVELPSGRVGRYAYPRYFFSNLSPDIRRIFTDHCDLLGIRWTQSNPRNISIAHRPSVALLDSFIGPKA